MVGDCPAVGPVEEVASRVTAQPMRGRSDPDAAQVQPVRVPAGLQRWFARGQAIGVQPAGFEQHLEPIVVEVNEASSKGLCQLGATQSMIIVPLLVDAPGVVENREKRSDFAVAAVQLGNAKTVLQNARPVNDTVISAKRKRVSLENRSHDRRHVMDIALGPHGEQATGAPATMQKPHWGVSSLVCCMVMKRFSILALLLTACGSGQPAERYGFIALLGRDTISVESVTREGNRLTSDAVDRFPRVRQRRTEIDLAEDGRIRRLVMDIHTPSEPENQRDRRVEVEVGADSVRISKRDRSGTVRRAFATDGGVAMAHLPQMYSLYELYLGAALRHASASKVAPGERIPMRQFYIDREFDRFPLHRGSVRQVGDGKVEIRHDWLAGTGEATLDSIYRLLSYTGARTTYRVEVARLAEPPDVKTIGARFAAVETQAGGMKQLSVRDTVRATIGGATFEVDYSRPLARGRQLAGGILPYEQVWRTGANAATQFTTSAPITLAGVPVPAGTYTLWTIPRSTGATLIVNRQTGQWGTGYNPAHDLGRAPMVTSAAEAPVDKFTISVQPVDATRGSLTMEWGTFRWTAPIRLQVP